MTGLNDPNSLGYGFQYDATEAEQQAALEQRALGPHEAVSPADAAIAEGKALAEKVYGCEVEPKGFYQVLPAEHGRAQVRWGPKRPWWWPFGG